MAGEVHVLFNHKERPQHITESDDTAFMWQSEGKVVHFNVTRNDLLFEYGIDILTFSKV